MSNLPFAWDRISLGVRIVYPGGGVRMASSVECALIQEVERLRWSLGDAMEVLGYRDRDIEKFRKGTLAFTAEVERLRTRVRELESAHEPMAAAVVAAYEFIRRECAETNPETGEVVDAGALPTWNLVCEGYAYAAVSAEVPDGHTRMTDGITPHEPTEWLEDLNAVSAEKED